MRILSTVHYQTLVNSFPQCLPLSDLKTQPTPTLFFCPRQTHQVGFQLVNAQFLVQFSHLFEKATSKTEIIVIFLAVLELIRLKEIIARQKQAFGEIEIVRHPEHVKAKTT